MKEVTRIVTLEITTIGHGEGEPQPLDTRKAELLTKKLLDVDDVRITNVQDFIVDKDDCNG